MPELDLRRLADQLTDLAVIPSSPTLQDVDFPFLFDAEQQICEALSHIRSLQTSQNSFISRLPPEILADVFRHLLHEQDRGLLPFVKPSLRPWHTITSVCRFWRRTALSTSDLWNQVHVKDGVTNQSAEVFFQRSKLSPIRLHFNRPELSEFYGEPYDSPMLLNALGDMSRLEELHVQLAGNLKADFCQLLQHPAPRLRSLSLLIHSALTDDDTTLPFIFRGHLPVLESLSLCCTASWPHNHFKNLTRLALYNQPLNKRVTVAKFLNFLSESPNLEDLRLVSAGPGDHSPGHPLTPITLPLLEHLEVGDRQLSWVTMYLLENLALPRSTERWFWERYRPWSSTHPKLVKGFFQHPQDVDRVDELKCIVCSTHSTDSHLHHRYLTTIKGDTLFVNGTDAVPWFRPPRRPSKNRCYYSVEKLYWMERQHRPYQTLTMETLELFPSLKFCSLSGVPWEQAKNLFRLLKWAKDSSEGDSPPRFAPLLTSLHICPVDPPKTEQELGTLLRMGQFRIRVNHPLENLIAEGLAEDMMQLLRDTFGHRVVEAELSDNLRPDDFRNYWLKRHLKF